MTLQELLNADIDVIGEMARQGFAWWIAELAEMVPPRWRGRPAADRPIAELAESGEAIRIWRRGRFVERRAGDKARPQRADLGLPADLALERDITLPALGPADLKRMVANDLDRLTPFHADAVYFDLVQTDRPATEGRRTLRLGVIERSTAEAALEAARLCGVQPRRLGMLSEERQLRFDFLGAVRAAGRGGRPDWAPLYWWLAVVILLAVNVSALVLKDMDDVATLRATVEMQRPAVTLAQTLRQRVETEGDSRKQLLARRDHNEPLRILDATTRAFPPPQWVQRLEWNGRAVRITGYRDPGFDVLSAVRASPVLARPRTLSAAETPAPGARPGFDVVADPVGGGGRP